MAAAPEKQNHAAGVGFDDDDDDLDDSEDSDMDDYEDDDVSMPAPPTLPLASSSSAAAAAVIGGGPVLSSNPNPNPNRYSSSLVISQPKADDKTPPPAPPSVPSADESRKLFQRLWTDNDEIKILKGFLEFTSSRGTTFASHQYDTGPFYEQIKNQLQLDFNKSQLIEKLRRLKKKYRNTAARMAGHGAEFSFKSSHEQATYDIARRIWSVGGGGGSGSVKRSSRESDDDLNPSAGSERMASRPRKRGRKRAIDSIPMLPAPPLPVVPPLAAVPSEGVVRVQVQTSTDSAPIIPPIPSVSQVAPPLLPAAAAIPSIIEETVKSCLSPMFKELLNSFMTIGPHRSEISSGLGFGPLPVLSYSAEVERDEKWKKQHILELEVYLKRVELVRDQIKSKLEELKMP